MSRASGCGSEKRCTEVRTQGGGPSPYARVQQCRRLRANLWSSNIRFGWLQQANTGLFVVYTDSQMIDERDLGPQTTDRSLIIKFSQMFDALN